MKSPMVLYPLRKHTKITEKKIEPTTKVRNLNVSLTVCILLFKTSEVYGELIAISALCPVEQQLLP